MSRNGLCVAMKWKDRKTRLRGKFFDETLTDEQLKDKLKEILNVDDMNKLIEYWRSPEFQVSNNSRPFFHYLPINVHILMISTIGSQ
jgi:hypothetical protein